jgi:hypothetical protein
MHRRGRCADNARVQSRVPPARLEVTRRPDGPISSAVRAANHTTAVRATATVRAAAAAIRATATEVPAWVQQL